MTKTTKEEETKPEKVASGTSEELFAMFGSENPERDARGLNAILRRGAMKVVKDDRT